MFQFLVRSHVSHNLISIKFLNLIVLSDNPVTAESPSEFDDLITVCFGKQVSTIIECYSVQYGISYERNEDLFLNG
jgi:hypothetical protein